MAVQPQENNMDVMQNASTGDIGGVFTPMVSDVPVDIYNFFNIPPFSLESKELDVLREVRDWAFGDGSSLGDGMQKLKDIEIKLGHARLSDGKLSKIHNYITLDNQVADLIKRREAV